MAVTKELPEKYYLSHFHEFLTFFDGPNRALLLPEHTQFIQQFCSFSEDLQCIVVRAATRKYTLINRNQFRYDEITSPQAHIDELIRLGWLTPINNAKLRYLPRVLTKAELLTLLACYQSVKGLSSENKEAIGSLVVGAIQTQGWPDELPFSHYLHCQFEDLLSYLRFLYFGHTKGKLNQFSMRDLGIRATRAESTGDIMRFDSADEAHAAFTYALQAREIRDATAAQLNAMATQPLPATQTPSAQRYQDMYLFALGNALLNHQPELGVTLLGQAQDDKSVEKWLREAYKLGLHDEVKQRLESIIDEPTSELLNAFAEDFLARKFGSKRTSTLTDMLRNAQHVLSIDESYLNNVERGVINYYKKAGLAAYRTENELWVSLFGLTFWTLLFERENLVSEFDRRPLCLKENRFYLSYIDDIEELLNSFTDNHALFAYISKMATKHYGVNNVLFRWHDKVLQVIRVLLQHTNYAQICHVLRAMAKDLASYDDGFPDIMVVENERLRFEEIKAPGDSLRRNQLVSIKLLQKAEFDVEITQVEWFRDPEQAYVVVDIETTGGGASYHRITEIGAVKVVNGEVVDEWQSLINPQRHIPQRITQLTGISNHMVADAPVFAEIAEDFAAFTEDAVFVAHNVNFDYGFIKQEFERLGVRYRRPKQCTVRLMRKVKPGLDSYSLAALTKYFGISMEQHHRALSDARAAAELLKIVHEAG